MSFLGLFKSQEQKDQEMKEKTEQRDKRYLADTVGEPYDQRGPGGEEAYKAQVAEQNKIADAPAPERTKFLGLFGGKRSRKYRKGRKSRKSRGKRSKRF